jgi:uncharacterized protein YbjT (DUF2867 family)
MKVILFGATGMVGQGVLRECLLDSAVEAVVSIRRGSQGERDTKLRELVHVDFLDFSAIEDQLSGFDACFFCLGVSSAGMAEHDYESITHGFALAAAHTLVALNPNMTFIYVSGAGTDSTERGRSMGARVKGKTENELLRLGFRGAYMFRPGLIVPLHGIQSKTTVYRVFYTLLSPLLPFLYRNFPKYVTTTEQIGRAMIGVAQYGWPKQVLETYDINQVQARVQNAGSSAGA